jgi:hypothetical protein
MKMKNNKEVIKIRRRNEEDEFLMGAGRRATSSAHS